MKLNFTPDEVKILERICSIQIKSYRKIIHGRLEPEEEFLISQFQSSGKDVIQEAKWRLQQYRELEKQPLYLGIMVDQELSTMRHILFNIEEEYMDIMPYAVHDLWGKFFAIEEERHPEIKLSLLNTRVEKKGIFQKVLSICK